MSIKTSPITFFLLEYIRSLNERSRFEKSGFKNGLDWLILELGIQKGWLSFRTPFSIGKEQKLKSKSEGEFGIDIAFLSKNKRNLYIFVIKDEKLNNHNFTEANFDKDLRKAASPKMNQEGLEKVQKVIIITAYNKEEDRNGIELYENLINEFPDQFGSKAQYKRVFRRWNINRIVEEVKNSLLTPELLPNQLISQFRYICSQIKDFDYCSKEWLYQLEPNWKNFVEIVLGNDINENKINLLALSIYILKDSWKSEEKSHAGWIDLLEWAMLALWRRYYNLSDTKQDKIIKNQIFNVWIKIYLIELEMYFVTVDPVLRTQHGLSLGNLQYDMNFIPINDAFRVFWHMGRLGLLSLAPQDIDFGDDAKEVLEDRIKKYADLMTYLIRANPASSRPLMDIHHIELFLLWLVLYQAGRENVISLWLNELENYLSIRRFSKSVNLPFIQSNNDMDSLIELMLKDDVNVESEESSSYLLLMLIELCFSVRNIEQRDNLIKRFLNRLVKGIRDDGEVYKKQNKSSKERIDLLSWSPPKNWEEKILSSSLAREGIGVTTGNFEKYDNSITEPLPERIESFVNSMRNKFPFEYPKKLPLSVCILACIKHKSPLPPELWRSTIFPIETETICQKNGVD